MMNVPIIGGKKTAEQIMAEKIAMQQMIQSLPVLTCPKCGEVHFQQVFLLRLQPGGGAGQTVIPDQAYMCTNLNCRHVLGDEEPDAETPEPDPLNESNPESCDSDNQSAPYVPEEDQNEDDAPDDKPGLSLV